MAIDRLIAMLGWLSSFLSSARRRSLLRHLFPESAISSPKCDPSAISAFWGNRLLRIKTLVEASAATDQLWDDSIPPGFRPSDGKLKIAAFASLMYQANLGGSRWVDQFAYGFPPIGSLALIRRFPYPPDSNAKKTPPPPPRADFSGCRCPFFELPKKSGRENGAPVERSFTEKAKGWIDEPCSLSASSPFKLKSHARSIASRIGVAQAGEIRAYGDLRYSHTNLACEVRTPIDLISRCHIADLSLGG